MTSSSISSAEAPASPEGPVRVLAIADHLGHPSGRVHGGTTYFLSVYPALKEAGIDLSVCFLSAYHPAAKELESHGITPTFLNRKKYDPRVYRDLRSLIAEGRPDVLHLASLRSHFLGRLLGRRFNIPSIVHLHDTKSLSWPMRKVQRAVAKDASLALGVSGPVCDIGIDDYGIDRRRVQVLRNAVDLTKFNRGSADEIASVRAELGLEADVPVVGIVGRLSEMKGHCFLIEAFVSLLKQVPNVKLLVVGEGEEEAELKAQAERLGIASHVLFTGQRSDVSILLQVMDVLAMPSIFGEGLPYAAIEATVSGTPVVAFPDAGIPEVVRDGINGLLVPKKDVSGLAHALGRVLMDKQLASELEAGARKVALEFSMARHVEELQSIYCNLRTRD